MDPNPSPANRQKHIIFMSILSVLFTAFVCWIFYLRLQNLETYKLFARVNWKNEKKITIKETPVWFLYEKDSSFIATTKIMNIEDKQQFKSIIDTTKDLEFVQAIDKLAFYSNSKANIPLYVLLIIGGLASILGVQIRSLFDLVGHACFKNDVDLIKWWPWYVLRPVFGFLGGGFIVIALYSKILSPGENVSGEPNFYLMGLTILAGFGIIDVVDLMRSLSKKIFGTDKYNKQESPSNDRQERNQ